MPLASLRRAPRRWLYYRHGSVNAAGRDHPRRRRAPDGDPLGGRPPLPLSLAAAALPLSLRLVQRRVGAARRPGWNPAGGSVRGADNAGGHRPGGTLRAPADLGRRPRDGDLQLPPAPLALPLRPV